NGRARVRKDEHEGVADLLHQATVPGVSSLPDNHRKTVQDMCCLDIPHRFGHRREACEINERYSALQLSGKLARLEQSGLFGHVHDEVFPNCFLPVYPGEREDARIAQRTRDIRW